MTYRLLVIILACVGGGAASHAYADGDVGFGRKEFEQDCAVCHSVKEGKNKIGPSLHGIVGRKSASVADFNYSDAMRAYNVVWTPDTLKPYICSPQDTVPGAKMAFKGEESDKDIDNIIAYLMTLH
jgi:cytochrome c